jgi:hypothetical protein
MSAAASGMEANAIFEISNFRFAILIDSYVTAPGGALATQGGVTDGKHLFDVQCE